MTRRNLLLLVVVGLLAVVCSLHVHPNPYIGVISEAVNIIERRSLEPVDDMQLFEGAMQGMLGRLDENSFFISEDDLSAFREDIDREFAGVGMEIAMDPETGQLVVRSPLEGSPAYRAGVLAGDRILKIDGKGTVGMALSDALAMLRGPAGVPVSLVVLHIGEREPVTIDLVREIIHVETVLGDTRNEDGSWNYSIAGHPGVGYVRINSFAETTADELENVLKSLADWGMRGLVLDLRDDPGGWLTAAVEVCDQLVASGVIVTIRRRGGRISESYEASGDGRFVDLPIAVVVNQETASAAEIVAACLQDHDRAVVVGQRTYGKGTVQEVIELRPGCGAMKFTTASYWRPSGRNIQRPRDPEANGNWGVLPSKGFDVPLTDEQYVEWQKWRIKRDAYQPPVNGDKNEQTAQPYIDLQRQRAVTYIERVIGAAAQN